MSLDGLTFGAQSMRTFMSKIDFRKRSKHLYAPSAKEFAIVDVPPVRYLMIDGRGDPNTSETYREAIEALYAVSYTLKFASKKEFGRDYVVPPLEALWWAEDMSAFASRNKDQWCWTAMIMVPEWIGPAQISDAVDTARAKKIRRPWRCCDMRSCTRDDAFRYCISDPMTKKDRHCLDYTMNICRRMASLSTASITRFI